MSSCYSNSSEHLCSRVASNVALAGAALRAVVLSHFTELVTLLCLQGMLSDHE